eukprot:30886-Pelagococcus_subviridis.AAC.12
MSVTDRIFVDASDVISAASSRSDCRSDRCERSVPRYASLTDDGGTILGDAELKEWRFSRSLARSYDMTPPPGSLSLAGSPRRGGRALARAGAVSTAPAWRGAGTL